MGHDLSNRYRFIEKVSMIAKYYIEVNSFNNILNNYKFNHQHTENRMERFKSRQLNTNFF